MTGQDKRPILTLKHGAHPAEPAGPLQQPHYLLKRRHSKTQCAVYLKHPRSHAYLGTSANRSRAAERSPFGARSAAAADKSRARAQPKAFRHEAGKP